MMILQIDSGYFCAGVVLDNDRVQRTAPIVKYMLGWTLQRVRDYCERKSWRLQGALNEACVSG